MSTQSRPTATRITFVFLALCMLITGNSMAAGGAYSIDFSAARPGSYYKLYPLYFPCTASNGVDNAPISGATFLDNVESLAPKDLALGQIVAFEAAVTVNGNTSDEEGHITFTAGWNTILTSGDLFGYDETQGVYCAFIDTGDPTHVDVGNTARVSNFSWELQDNANPAGPDEIVGTFNLEGLDDGDHVIVEIWLVLQDQVPLTASGNVQSRLISAETSLADAISTGNQTVPLLKVKDFISAKADLAITKTDTLDPVTYGEALSYVVTVTNQSEDTVANLVVVTDTLDDNTRFISAVADGPIGYPSTCTHDGSLTGGVVTCNLGAFVPGESVDITITVEVLDSAPSTGIGGEGPCPGNADLCNNVSVSAITDDDDETNNSDSEPTAVDTFLTLTCPNDIIISCDESSLPTNTGTPLSTGNCPSGATLVYTDTVETEGSPCAEAFTIRRVWTATDNCGDSLTCTQLIVVADTSAPILADVPTHTTVECDAVPAPATPTATDNCDSTPTITFAETRTDGNCTDSYSLARVWTATDNCGNSSSQTQTITVVDTTDPVLSSVPSNTTVECDSVPAPAQPTASDNCDDNVSIGYVETRTDGDCTDSYSLARVWTATDNCNNSSSQTQTITVVDTTDPILAGVPGDTTVECDSVPAPAEPTASDNCDNDVNIGYVETRTDGDCTDSYSLARVWTATDNCNNSSSQTQTITVVDTTDPILAGVPGDTTVECDSVPAPAQPTASDNCDNSPNITYEETRTDGACDDSYTLTRTWTATDNCGNSSSQTQAITVQDTTAPELAGVPDDTTVECDSVPAAATPTASDNCDSSPNITYEETRTDGACTDSYSLARVWTATDNCNNSSSQTQTITVVDTTDPVLAGVPTNTTVECDSVPAPAQPTASDNCDSSPDITYEETRTDGACDDSYTLTRTWTATDNCGNSSSQTQAITVQDTTDPTLAGVPEDTTIECDSVPAPAEPTASDNCDENVTIDYVETRTDGDCTDSYSLARVWTATDNCGNSSSQTQTITVIDTTDPVLAGVPDDTTVECDSIPAPAEPTASDNCDAAPEITYKETRTDGDCTDSYSLDRVWTATDNCGNSSSQTQTITVVDTTDPVLVGVPADDTVECDSVPAPVTPMASDNCDTEVSVVFTEYRTDTDCEFNYTLTRTWTATDNCRNSTTVTRTLIVRDTTAPTIVAPSNILVECDSIPDPGTVEVSDNCSTVAVEFAEETMGPCAGRVTELTLQYNGSNAVYLVIEQRLPKAPPIAFEGVVQPGEIFTFHGTGTDNLLGSTLKMYVDEEYYSDIHTSCSSPIGPGLILRDFEVLAGKSRDGGILCPIDDLDCINHCSYTLFRTWTATDACGNQSSVTQRVEVADVTPPVITGVPTDTTVECDAVPSPASVSVSDNCTTGISALFSEQRTDGASPDNYTLTRVWSATDDCSNTVSVTQTVTVVDTAAPTLSGVPADTTVECDAVPTPANVTAPDTCDSNPLIQFVETRADGDCPEAYTLTRVWTATDRSGNATSATQTVAVADTTPPILEGASPSRTVECDSVPTPDSVSATDACAGSVAVTFDESQTAGACPGNYTLTRTWTASDNCGNSTSVTQVLTVEDTTDPVLVGVPTNTSAKCDAVPAPATVSATDNCSDGLQVTFNETRTDGECMDSYTLTRTWLAIDACGNAAVATQLVTVADSSAPTLGAAPADVTVECDAVPAPATLGVQDNCDDTVEIAFEESRTDGSCTNSYTLTRTWTATDTCGNSTSATQVLTVEDTTDPVLVGVPANTSAECDAVPAPATVSATDNCSDGLQVTFNETEIDQDGGTYQLIRSWTAVDSCNNSVTATQTINVADTTNPTISGAPTNLTVECDAIPSPAELTASDNCDAELTLQFEESREDGNCSNRYVLVRTWTATDVANNSTGVTQIITIQDTTSPEIIEGPPDQNFISTNEVPPANTGLINAQDNCGTVLVLHLGDIVTGGTGTLRDPLIIERTYAAGDDCSNFTNYVQTITVSGVAAIDPIIITDIASVVVGATISIQFTTTAGLELTPQYATELQSTSTTWTDLVTTSESYTNGVYTFSFDPLSGDPTPLFIRVIQR